jgi:hypothetical protein
VDKVFAEIRDMAGQSRTDADLRGDLDKVGRAFIDGIMGEFQPGDGPEMEREALIMVATAVAMRIELIDILNGN